MAATATGSPKISAQALKVLLLEHDQRAPLVAGADEREEQRGGLGVERDVADLVDDEQRDPPEALELLVEPPRPLGRAQAVDPLVGGGEGDPVAASGGLDPEGDRQVGLAGPGRSQEHDVLGLGEEVELGEVGDQPGG